ncbi:MAG: carbamate kinase [Nitrososphaerota archaeon]|nr:carbamate kinase [Nitrososphaerota archaeon]
MAPEGGRTKILVALGGNAILKRGEAGTAEEQRLAVSEACGYLARMIEHGHSLVVTHGNGPQVGDILLKDELAKGTRPPMPLDVCGAESQGQIGYMIQLALRNELSARGLEVRVATVLTETVVDGADPAFANPTKPVGPFYTEADAAALRESKGWRLVNDSGRGYRRVVPSPAPLSIVQGRTIRELVDLGVVVIAAGGGGVPVTAGTGSRGVEAVIDKDLASAVLAGVVGSEVLMMLTDVDAVYADFQSPTRRPIAGLSVGEARRLLDSGRLPPGSMGPKVQSAVNFLESGGRRAVITSLENAEDALAGTAGTTILP